MLILETHFYMHEILDLINGMSPFLLLGFFCAGLMHAFVPKTLYQKYLGGSTLRSVCNAVLLGIPVPLCSCGVIPTAMSLRRDGASRGATVAFLITTPQTGIDAVMATYSLMGWPFALIRPIAAITTAIVGGSLTNLFFRNEKNAQQRATEEPTANAVAHKTFANRLRDAMHYAFVEMMQDIGRWLVVGLIVAGIITVAVPDAWFALVADKPLLTMLLVLALAFPMYLCATGSIPIAVALMLKGFSPGTALVMLMAGPAVNLASMLIVNKVMGRKTLLLYIASIVLGALAFGLAVDHLLPTQWFAAPIEHIHHCHEHGTDVFSTICSIVLLLLIGNAFIRRHQHHHHCDCECECHSHAHTAEHAWRIKVSGMSCNHCRSNVEKAIMKIEGVERTEVTLASGEAIVYGTFDKAAVRKAIEAIGFEVSEP